MIAATVEVGMKPGMMAIGTSPYVATATASKASPMVTAPAHIHAAGDARVVTMPMLSACRSSSAALVVSNGTSMA
ncbi:MAG TPA: hypothetical protein VF801_06395 [Rhodocyclaceae bacterium]